jgi:hypothetical protein
LKLDKSIDSLFKKIERIDHSTYDNGDGNGNSNNGGIKYWKGRKVISLNEWKKIANRVEYCGSPSKLRIDEAIQYVPDEYNGWLFAYGVPVGYKDKANKWYSDYRELMEHLRNPSYGKAKCFHCLLCPNGDCQISFGLNRQVAKGLSVVQNTTNNTAVTAPPPYPCPCDYKNENGNGNTANADFDLEDLFELSRMIHAVEHAIRLAQRKQKGYNNNSKFRKQMKSSIMPSKNFIIY